MKLDLLESEDADTIAKIWTEFHANKECISAVIPSHVYNELYARGQKYPMVCIVPSRSIHKPFLTNVSTCQFIVPLPQPTGFEFYVLQFIYHTVLFTSL